MYGLFHGEDKQL